MTKNNILPEKADQQRRTDEQRRILVFRGTSSLPVRHKVYWKTIDNLAPTERFTDLGKLKLQMVVWF